MLSRVLFAVSSQRVLKKVLHPFQVCHGAVQDVVQGVFILDAVQGADQGCLLT